MLRKIREYKLDFPIAGLIGSPSGPWSIAANSRRRELQCFRVDESGIKLGERLSLSNAESRWRRSKFSLVRREDYYATNGLSAQISPDGSQVAISSPDSKLSILQLPSLRMLFSTGRPGEFDGVCWADSDNIIATRTLHKDDILNPFFNQVAKWNIKTEKIEYFDADDQILLSARNFLLSLTDMGGSTEIFIRETATFEKLSFSGTCYVRPDGAIYSQYANILAISELDNTHRCIVIDTSNWTKISSAILESATERPDEALNLSLISMSPSGRNILIPGPRGTILEMHANSSQFRQFTASSHEITGIISLAEILKIAIADSDGNISIWEETFSESNFSTKTTLENLSSPPVPEWADLNLDVEFE